MLGHKDAKTTSIYVNTTLSRLHDSMRRFGTQSFHMRPKRATASCATTTPKPGLSPLSTRGRNGARGRARTCGLRLRRPSLYPTELHAHMRVTPSLPVA